MQAFADAHAMLESEITCLHKDDDDDTDPKLTCKVLPKLIPSIVHFVGSWFMPEHLNLSKVLSEDSLISES